MYAYKFYDLQIASLTSVVFFYPGFWVVAVDGIKSKCIYALIIQNYLYTSLLLKYFIRK